MRITRTTRYVCSHFEEPPLTVQCYYLMSFDQNMIIDATKGSIARFVNHSCKPNCRMVKWIVGGKPRMALFAGDNPIMSGDELTYDYNFDPFSAKNVQECRCGSDNCRGVLGPKPKPVKEAIKDAVKAGVKAVKGAVKRKAMELLGVDADDNAPSSKRRQVKKATGVKRSSATMKSVNGAAVTVKKSVSTTLLSARHSVKARSRIGGKVSKSVYARTYSKTAQTKSRKTSTIAARKVASSKPRPSSKAGPQKSAVVKKGGGNRPAQQEVDSDTIQVVMDDGDYEDMEEDE